MFLLMHEKPTNQYVWRVNNTMIKLKNQIFRTFDLNRFSNINLWFSRHRIMWFIVALAYHHKNPKISLTQRWAACSDQWHSHIPLACTQARTLQAFSASPSWVEKIWSHKHINLSWLILVLIKWNLCWRSFSQST